MSDEDGGLPEESAGKLEQENAVSVEAKGPWRNSSDMWTFQNFTELDEYAAEVAFKDAPQVVLVIDNEDADIVAYPKNKHYWIINPLTFDSGTTSIEILHLTEYFSILVEEGTETLEVVNSFEPDDNFIKLGTYQGYAVLARDPAIDDSRPQTQTAKTTGQTTGTTVTTTTTIKPGAAGASTKSTIDPDDTDPRGKDQRNTPASSTTPATPTPSAASTSNQSSTTGADGKVQQGSLPPCLPQNAGSGSGATPPASASTYDDGPLRAVRAAAAAPVSALTSRLDSKGATPTAPTTVTAASAAQQTNSSTAPTPRPASVYIYEPITPGFDRYDFNTGKKVYTPNNGTSRSSSGQPTSPASGPATVSSAAQDGGIPVGTTTAATGSLLKQRQAALSGGAG